MENDASVTSNVIVNTVGDKIILKSLEEMRSYERKNYIYMSSSHWG